VSAPATETAGTAIAASSVDASLSGATSNAGGTITYTVFGPQSSAPTDCSSGGTNVGTATVSSNGSYSPSAGYTPPGAGTYYWYASYSGDGGDQPANSTCGTAMTATVVSPAVVPPPVVPPTTLSRLNVSPDKLSITGRRVHGKCVSPTRRNTADKHCLRPIRLTVGYALNAVARVTFTVRRKASGRNLNVRGRIVRAGAAGANRFIWNGKIGGRELAPGSYELTATCADGISETVMFTIVG
jgi:hypothetical protein